jgi:hypothetical protein
VANEPMAVMFYSSRMGYDDPRMVSSQTTNREPETEPTCNYSPVWIADPKHAVSYAAAGQILSEQAEAPR